MKLKSTAKKNVVIATALCLIMAVGGIAAYFTSTDDATNTFTVGNVTIDLTEPEYDNHPEEHTDITPNMEIVKDPTITNTGVNDAYVFAKFSIPKANVTVAGQDGTKGTKAVQELFDYTIANGWTKVTEDTSAADKNTYVYAYGSETECTALAAGNSAPILFKDSKVTFKNMIEGEGLETTTIEIPINAYAIQTTDITAGDVVTPTGVWSVLAKQQNVK